MRLQSRGKLERRCVRLRRSPAQVAGPRRVALEVPVSRVRSRAPRPSMQAVVAVAEGQREVLVPPAGLADSRSFDVSGLCPDTTVHVFCHCD